ncbi:MAG: flavin reductase family protein [Hyphomicrobiaceae bacterium]|nr:flavin reductase family protein [Hyphomicrobiaceae bacterium]
MEFDFAELAADERYKLLTSTIVPRPIAWVTTVSADGVRNAAPFSFFNAMGKEPPLLAIGIQGNDDGSLKDTARNIIDTREFVVNLVTEHVAHAMNLTSIAAPADIDELALAELDVTPSIKVAVPRISASRVAFECRLHTPLQFASGQVVVIGEVLQAHVDDAYVLDAAKLYIDTPKLAPIGRVHGRGLYVRTVETFQIDRPSPVKAPQ